MDSRAKQRLTGAVILVALFVLLVPELLTGPKNAAQAPATAEEEGLRRYTIDLNAPTPAGSQPVEAAVQLPPVSGPRGEQDTAQELAQPGEAASAAGEAGAGAQIAVDPPARAASPPPVTAPARVEAAPTPTPAVSRATPPADKPATTGPGRFVVQLGSFGSRENADRLVRDMNAKGFTTFLAPITTNGRELYRVRVGPTKDRAAAEALAAQLKRVGQSGSIVPIP